MNTPAFLVLAAVSPAAAPSIHGQASTFSDGDQTFLKKFDGGKFD